MISLGLRLSGKNTTEVKCCSPHIIWGMHVIFVGFWNVLIVFLGFAVLNIFSWYYFKNGILWINCWVVCAKSLEHFMFPVSHGQSPRKKITPVSLPFSQILQLHLKSMDIRSYDVSMLSHGQNTPNLEISFKVIFSELELVHGNKSCRRDRREWVGGAALNGAPETRLRLGLWERVFIWLEESAFFFFSFFRKVIWILI